MTEPLLLLPSSDGVRTGCCPLFLLSPFQEEMRVMKTDGANVLAGGLPSPADTA